MESRRGISDATRQKDSGFFYRGCGFNPSTGTVIGVDTVDSGFHVNESGGPTVTRNPPWKWAFTVQGDIARTHAHTCAHAHTHTHRHTHPCRGCFKGHRLSLARLRLHAPHRTVCVCPSVVFYCFLEIIYRSPTHTRFAVHKLQSCSRFIHLVYVVIQGKKNTILSFLFDIATEL